MKNVLKYLVVLLIVGSVAVVAASCTPTAPAAAPTSAPAVVAEPTAAPTSAAVPAVAPTVAPTEAPVVAPTKTPSELELVPRISMEDLKALMDSGANIAILDVRAKASYDLGHIKGAVSFPWKPEMSVVDVEMLPMGDPIITYCDCGPGEHDSASVAAQLTKLGAEAKIMVLADPAIEGWIAAGYPTE